MTWILIIAAILLASRGAVAPSVGKLPEKPGEPAGAGGRVAPKNATIRRDGPWRIALWRAGGEWTWLATREGSDQRVDLGHVFQAEEGALVDAWIELAKIPVDKVVNLPAARWGLVLGVDGALEVSNLAQYVNHASGVISKAQQAGEDAAGIVLAVLMDAFGSDWNPLRVTIAGDGLQAAAERVQATNPPNPPAVAKAIVSA